MVSFELWRRYALLNVMAGGFSHASNLSAIVCDSKTLREVIVGSKEAMHGEKLHIK